MKLVAVWSALKQIIIVLGLSFVGTASTLLPAALYKLLEYLESIQMFVPVMGGVTTVICVITLLDTTLSRLKHKGATPNVPRVYGSIMTQFLVLFGLYLGVMSALLHATRWFFHQVRMDVLLTLGPAALLQAMVVYCTNLIWFTCDWDGKEKMRKKIQQRYGNIFLMSLTLVGPLSVVAALFTLSIIPMSELIRFWLDQDPLSNFELVVLTIGAKVLKTLLCQAGTAMIFRSTRSRFQRVFVTNLMVYLITLYCDSVLRVWMTAEVVYKIETHNYGRVFLMSVVLGGCEVFARWAFAFYDRLKAKRAKNKIKSSSKEAEMLVQQQQVRRETLLAKINSALVAEYLSIGLSIIILLWFPSSPGTYFYQFEDKTQDWMAIAIIPFGTELVTDFISILGLDIFFHIRLVDGVESFNRMFYCSQIAVASMSVFAVVLASAMSIDG